MAKHVATYQARFDANPEAGALLSGYGELFGRIERTLYVESLASGRDLASFKSSYLTRFGVTARQFNAVSIGLEGKISSVRERLPGLVEEKQAAIGRARAVLKKIKNPEKLHQKKRRLARLESRLAGLKTRHAAGDPHICFGSRRLFRRQFALAENGYATHDQWLADWRKARAGQFLVLGSGDETAGCQGCQASVAPDSSFALQLRLPDALAGGGKYLALAGIRFPYGDWVLRASLAAGRSISYRFLRDERGWRVFATTALPYLPAVTLRQAGAVGVDVNEDCLALSETDRFGNLVDTRVVPLCCYGSSAGQTRALIGEAAQKVVAFALAAGKPIVHERLDFGKKRSTLEGESGKRCRMLSSFAYRAILQALDSSAYRAGVQAVAVNPAYSSVIGAVSYAAKYGISVHQAAALVLARRGSGCRERPPKAREAVVPAANGDQVTLRLPERNRGRHVWSFWAAAHKIRKAVLAAHARLSRDTPARQDALPAQGTCPAFTVRFRDAKRRQDCSADVMDEIPW